MTSRKQFSWTCCEEIWIGLECALMSFQVKMITRFLYLELNLWNIHIRNKLYCMPTIRSLTTSQLSAFIAPLHTEGMCDNW